MIIALTPSIALSGLKWPRQLQRSRQWYNSDISLAASGSAGQAATSLVRLVLLS